MSVVVSIKGSISINDREAEVLKHICSYGLHEWFAEHCSHQYTKDELWNILCGLNQQLTTIVNARDTAVDAINEAAILRAKGKRGVTDASAY